MLSLYKRKRLELGLKQIELAKLTGIEQCKISYIERGLFPTKEERIALNKALNIKKEKS